MRCLVVLTIQFLLFYECSCYSFANTFKYCFLLLEELSTAFHVVKARHDMHFNLHDSSTFAYGYVCMYVCLSKKHYLKNYSPVCGDAVIYVLYI